MTKIAISTYQAANLSAARRAGEKRTHIWAGIRDMFRIPRTVKLGMATDRSLYVKGSEPRQFLMADARGYYTGVMTDAQIAAANTARSANAVPVSVATTPAQAAPVAAAPVAASASNQASPFRVLNPGVSNRQLTFIKTADLAEALRGSGYGDQVPVPAGFPMADIGSDSVVVTDDGVYVLADD